MSTTLPPSVLRSLGLAPDTSLARLSVEPLRTSSGAATGGVARISGEAESGAFSVIRKSLRPLVSGPHADRASDQTHWAYWKRELLAYESELVPSGSLFAAPRCLGIEGNDLYLEDVTGERQSAENAAQHLAVWQATTSIPDVPWLTRDQLGQRLAVTSLDWEIVDSDSRPSELWERRQEWLDRLRALPHVVAHGDYSLGNLLRRGDQTVAFDWGTLGVAPIGSDLAHLALSSYTNPLPSFLSAVSSGLQDDLVEFGFRATLALVGASRLHWMLSRKIEVPDGYVNFIWENRPRSL